MSDRSEEQEERYLRLVGRRMKIHPEGLLNRLRPLGFILLYANRHHGMNELEYLRPTPGLPGLFDLLQIKADVRGEHLAVYVSQTIVAHQRGVDAFVPATSYGYERHDARVRSVAEAIELEERLGCAAPDLFSAHLKSAGAAYYEETNSARAAAERYLSMLQPSDNLTETLQRLKASATEEQWQAALEFIRRDNIDPLNLVDFRPVWEIAGLCQVLYWEQRDTPYRGIGGGVSPRLATAADNEAHWRLHLVASRLARAPGWPIDDPLVPKRHDLEETILWRDIKPPYVAQVFDRYLATIDRRCVCGKCLYYVRHEINEDEPRTAAVLARCNNGHEEFVELAAAGLGTLLPEDAER